MRNKTFISSMVGFAAAVAVAGSANAAFTTAFNPTSAQVVNDAGPGNDLLVFTVGTSNISVTSLGLFNGYSDGARDVGIYAWDGVNNRGTGAVLVQASVLTTNSTNGYTFAACASTVLTAGQQYVVVGQSKNGMGSNTAAWANAGVGSGIASFDSYWYNGQPALDSSANATYVPAYFNANFQFSVVPAPGALALLGVAGLVGARRRRA